MEKELHSIKKFRAGNLGIIRLNRLAYPRNIKIKAGDEEFIPIGYDTYGHPIISEENFIYYKALKAIKERQGESFVPEVKYEHQPFAIKERLYNSAEGISEFEKEGSKEEQLKALKTVLIYRKRANFIKKPLDTFILFGKYALYNDGHVYMCTYERKEPEEPEKTVLHISEVTNFELGEEVHIPSSDDICTICRKKFNIDDVKNFATMEDEKKSKVHTECLNKNIEAIHYQKASKIIDCVYTEYTAESEIIREFDEFDKKEKVWYLYHTKQGDVAIRFKNKVIEIKWFGNFKPFYFEELFEKEEVTKKRLEDAKVIHAWSEDDAIRYLSMVKKF